MTAKGPNQNIIRRYLDLMLEVKQRIAIIDDLFSRSQKRENHLSPRVTMELLYLQLRYICELIALGCLLVHEDIPATRSADMMKSYAADRIMTLLHKLKPDFYPKPIEKAEMVLRAPQMPLSTPIRPRQPNHFHFTPRKEGYLGREELKKLYSKTGDVLHQGNLRRVLDATEREVDFDAIGEWRNLVMALLHEHVISLGNGEWQVVVSMNPQDDFRPKAFLARAAPMGHALEPRPGT